MFIPPEGRQRDLILNCYEPGVSACLRRLLQPGMVFCDVGANLALISSGRFPEVRTVVAIQPKLSESLAMAGSAQDFKPKSALIIVADEAEGNRVKAAVANPSRVQVVPLSGGTSQWVADKRVADAVFQWLKETY